MHAAASMHAASMAPTPVTHTSAAAAPAAPHLRDQVAVHVGSGIGSAENLDRLGLRGAETEKRERKQRIFEDTEPVHGATSSRGRRRGRPRLIPPNASAAKTALGAFAERRLANSAS
jgi:hypothetical protein